MDEIEEREGAHREYGDQQAVQDFLNNGPGMPQQRRQALLKHKTGWGSAVQGLPDKPELMTRKPKFWVVLELDGRRRAFCVRASSSMDARIRAAMAGLKQVIVEVRELDAKASVARRDRGRVLNVADRIGILGSL